MVDTPGESGPAPCLACAYAAAASTSAWAAACCMKSRYCSLASSSSGVLSTTSRCLEGLAEDLARGVIGSCVGGEESEGAGGGAISGRLDEAGVARAGDLATEE
jgi:hypothetical protein